MAGLTKEQRAIKEAEVAKKEVEDVSKVKKYRCDFKSYDEYNKYKGPKG